MGLGGINGAVPLAAVAGLFRPENAFMLSFAFIAGPGSILTAALMEGATKQRMFAALLAGFIATAIVIFAAGIGPKLLGVVNLKAIKIFGAISIGFVALMVAGIKIPDNVPLGTILLGIVVGLIWR